MTERQARAEPGSKIAQPHLHRVRSHRGEGAFGTSRRAVSSAGPGRGERRRHGSGRRGDEPDARGRLRRKWGRHRLDGVRPDCRRFRQDVPGADEGPKLSGPAANLAGSLIRRNPHVPAVHMNTRHNRHGQSWFGGGAI